MFPANIPDPDKEKKQRSLDFSDVMLTKFMPPWSHVGLLSATQWRAWVMGEPIAMICRETIVAYILSLDFKITPRDSKQYDELRPTIRHYTKLLEHGGYANGIDYTGLLEWLCSDLLDIPFGAASEVGHKNDDPNGRVLWLKPIDGGTLYPTLNSDYPVVQWVNGVTTEPVVFPDHAIARMYMSPSSIILREGWGMAPPEKVQLALEMLLRGDRYYANLLLDVPPAGILDLGDMEKDSAVEWVKAFQLLVANTSDAFRIPVLYEHTTKPSFIKFGEVPNDLMYDKIMMKHAAITASAYGLSLSDIGLQTTSASGETLAGSIRQERRTRKTGIARTKKKIKYFFELILPDYLQFDTVDMDDELNLGMARARLANSTAWQNFINMGAFTRKEARLQTVADGLLSVDVPEDPPAEPDVPAPVAPGGQPAKSPNRQLGTKVPASAGGMGEVTGKFLACMSINGKQAESLFDHVVDAYINKFLDYRNSVPDDYKFMGQQELSAAIYDPDDYLQVKSISETYGTRLSVVKKSLIPEIEGLDSQEVIKLVRFKLPEFLAKSILLGITDGIFEESMLNENLFDDTGEQVDNTLLLGTIRAKVANRSIEALKDLVEMTLEELSEEKENG